MTHPQSRPKSSSRQIGPSCQGLELGPSDARIDAIALIRSEGAEATVDPGNDVLTAKDCCVPDDAFRNDLGMLDVVNDVKPDLDLLADDLHDRSPGQSVESRPVDRSTFLLRSE